MTENKNRTDLTVHKTIDFSKIKNGNLGHEILLADSHLRKVRLLTPANNNDDKQEHK